MFIIFIFFHCCCCYQVMSPKPCMCLLFIGVIQYPELIFNTLMCVDESSCKQHSVIIIFSNFSFLTNLGLSAYIDNFHQANLYGMFQLDEYTLDVSTEQIHYH